MWLHDDAEKHVTGARRLVAIDVGSNTVRALAADVMPDGQMMRLTDRFQMTALGRGLETGGDMDTVAIRQTAEFVARFLCEVGPVDGVYCVGTAAARDAGNTEELQRALHDMAGVELAVVTGAEEARLTFMGAIASIDSSAAVAPLVADVGGRSTELAALRGGQVEVCSVALGARSLTENCLHCDPSSEEEMAAARYVVDGALAAYAEIMDGADLFIAAGGTACSAALLAGGQWELSHSRLMHMQKRLCRMTLDDRRAALAFDHPRAEVICGGLILLERLAARAPDRCVIITTGGIREGLLLSGSGVQKFVPGRCASDL